MTELSIDLTTHQVVAKRGEMAMEVTADMPQLKVGMPGTPGPIGPQGPKGETIIEGYGPPPLTLGSTGDYYLDLDAHTLYGPKGAAVYGGTPYEYRLTPTGADGASVKMGMKFKVTEPAALVGASVLVHASSTVDTGWEIQIWDPDATADPLREVLPAAGVLIPGGWRSLEIPIMELVVGKVYLISVWVPPGGAWRSYRDNWNLEQESGPLTICSRTEHPYQGTYENTKDPYPAGDWGTSPTNGYLPAITPTVLGIDPTAVWPEGIVSGAPGPQGATGPAGPPGGATLTGWWQYSTATTAPPTAGQLRTTGDATLVGSTVTGYLHHTDDDGLVWPDGTAKVGDLFYARDEQGNTWQSRITSVTSTVAGPTGYDTIVGTLISTTGTPAKNRRVQVNLIRQVDMVRGLNGVTGLWKGTQAEYDAIGTKDPNVVYVIV